MDTESVQQALQHPSACDGGDACQCAPGKYFVGCVKDSRYYLMAGPYATHQQAEADRNRALEVADRVDGRAWFLSWGVVRLADDAERTGRLNELGLL